MTNPRELADEVLSAVRGDLVNVWAKDMTDLARITASLFSKLTEMRRYRFMFLTPFLISVP